MAKNDTAKVYAPGFFTKLRYRNFHDTPVGKICHSIKNKALSLLDRTQKPTRAFSGKKSNLGGVKGFQGAELGDLYDSKIGKILVATSFGIAGILSGLSLAQVNPRVNELSSDSLHFIGIQEATAYDKQEQTILFNASLQKSIQLSEDAKQAAKKTADRLEAENARLKAHLKVLQKTPSAKKIPSIASIEKMKKTAEKKQKMIDGKLKKLLVLRGMKGALKHEGIPSGVTDYGKYISKQNISLRRIDEKIQALQTQRLSLSITPQSGEKTTSGEDLSEKKTTSIPSPIADEKKTILRESPPGEVVSPESTVISDALKSDRISSDEILGSIHGDIASGPSGGASIPVIVSAKESFDVPIQEGEKSFVKHGFSGTPVSDAFVPSLVASAPQTDDDARRHFSFSATVAPFAATGEFPIIPSVPPDGISSMAAANDKIQPKIIQPSSLGSITHSRITADDFSPEKLESFISRVQIILQSLEGDNPLKKARIFVKKVNIKGIPAWRVLLYHGDKTGYFTLKPGQKSRNYSLVSSESETIKWAEKKMKKWRAH